MNSSKLWFLSIEAISYSASHILLHFYHYPAQYDSTMSDKIPLGIRACLLGDAVRFNGGHKRLAFAVEQLAPYMRFKAICLEMAIGGLPTPSLDLLYSNDVSVNLADNMQQFAGRQVAALQHSCGYIVCAKSPSYGMARVRVLVRVYSEDGKDSRKNGVGLFTAKFLSQMPWLPMEEDSRLNDVTLQENFIERVYALYDLNMLWHKGLTHGSLIAFHSCYKTSLLVHSQHQYRQLGRFVASIGECDSLEAFTVEYRRRLLALLALKATQRNHTNMLMYVQGYFRQQLNTAQRCELAQLIATCIGKACSHCWHRSRCSNTIWLNT